MAGRYELSPCAACASKDSKIFGGIVKKANQLPPNVSGNVIGLTEKLLRKNIFFKELLKGDA
jgi:hypothetical protein